MRDCGFKFQDSVMCSSFERWYAGAGHFPNLSAPSPGTAAVRVQVSVYNSV